MTFYRPSIRRRISIVNLMDTENSHWLQPCSKQFIKTDVTKCQSFVLLMTNEPVPHMLLFLPSVEGERDL